jgi:hypothetical protein
MNSKYLTPVLIVALIGAVGTSAFFAGVMFKQFNNDKIVEAFDTRNQMFHNNGRGMMIDEMMQKGKELGEITEKNGNTITVKSQNGLTEKVILTGDTDISKTSDVTANDLQVGDQVMVFGQQENGQFTAEAININPLTRKVIYE